MQETTLPGGAPSSGFTIFDRLYVWNGTIYIVTSDPSAFPPAKLIISQPKDVGGGRNLDPTDKEMQIITPEEARVTLGERAVSVDGMTMIFYDTAQFMAHYYHWWGEIILGAMRVYSGLSLVPGIETPLPIPKRFFLPNILDNSWRDYAGVNGPLMRAAFPSSSIERLDLWEDMLKLNQTFVFERAMIVSRVAAHKNPLASKWFKMISSTMNATAPEHFWEPLRRRLVRNTVGYLPVPNNAGAIVTPPKSVLPIVTYVSRQGGGRRLAREANESLIKAMKGLEAEGICEFNVAMMEKLPFSKQVETVARSTIIIGVHGNGLTHQIWMPPTPRSTVFEIFYPESYIHDYEILARNVGHKHYAVWNDTLKTYPTGEWYEGVEYGVRENFQGNFIPVHGPAVAEMVRERLTQPIS
ncbi:hypothetical protein B0H34DRAFT_657522 [Crassisporium funariophilum]|nr:hypothetical protein B0H34DRAFT_657522 [Crassisporium funariophilum]